MENTFIEIELQDICHFREAILNSHQKIQNKLFRKTAPFKPVSPFKIDQENTESDPYIKSQYEDVTTNYFTQNTGFTSETKIKYPPNHKHDLLLDNYLRQYDMIYQNIEPEPFSEKTSFLNLSNPNYTARSSSKNIIQLFPKNKSYLKEENERAAFLSYLHNSVKDKSKISRDSRALQDSRSVFQERLDFKNSNSKIYRNNFGSFYKESKVKRSQEGNKSFVSERKSMRQTVKQRNSQRKKNRKSSLRSLFQKQPSVWTSNLGRKQDKKEEKGKNRDEIRQQVCKRIKKRIFLSSAVHESSCSSFAMIYQKQLRERQEIVNKIMNNPKVLKTYGKSIFQPKLIQFQ